MNNDMCYLYGPQPEEFGIDFPKPDTEMVTRLTREHAISLLDGSCVPSGKGCAEKESWESLTCLLERNKGITVWLSKKNNAEEGFCIVRADIVPIGVFKHTENYEKKIIATAIFTRKKI